MRECFPVLQNAAKCSAFNGFKPNLYDLFVLNELIHGKQIVVSWHVDNFKVSHQNPEKE